MRRKLLLVGFCLAWITLPIWAGQLYYSPVTVNNGQVPSTQTDFPMLISVTDARFKDLAHSGHVNDSTGFDIRPYSDSALTTALTYELERYNAATGEVVMWVKRASLDDGNVTYLGYGDSTLTSDGSSGSGTFSNNFVSVYHLKDGSTLDVNDSIGANNGTNHSASATPGKIDGASGFLASSSQYIDLSTGIAPTGITISAWVNATSFPNAYNGVVVRSNGPYTSYSMLFVKSDGTLACYCLVGGPASVNYDGTGSHTLSGSTWYYLTMTYQNIGTSGLQGYVNASSDHAFVGSGTNTDLVTTSATTNIGRDSATSPRYWNGTIDEVRVSSVARSQNWITTEYNNQGTPSTFETLGTEVPVASPTPTATATATPTPTPAEVSYGEAH